MAEAEPKAKSGIEEAADQAKQDGLHYQHQTETQVELEDSCPPSDEHSPESRTIEGPSESLEGTKPGSPEPRAQIPGCGTQTVPPTNPGLSAPLWCPVRGRNHSNLIEFGLNSCPICKMDLSPPPETRNSDAKPQAVEKTETESSEGETSEGSQSDNESEPAQESECRFVIHFMDNAGGYITMRPWNEILDLETERAKMSRQVGPPVEMITKVATSLSAEWRRNFGPMELDRLSKDFLTNPNYILEVDYRVVGVRSSYIKQALRQLVTYWPHLNTMGDVLEIDEPYCLYYHHSDAIIAYQRTFSGAKDYDESSGDMDWRKQKPGFKPCDEISYNHLTILRNTVESQNLAAVLEEYKRYEQSPAMATFGMLWLLLKPGTTVYTKIHGRLAACVIKVFHFSPDFSLRKESRAYRVEMWHLQYDGKVLGRHELTRFITAFQGEKKLVDLEIIPAKYYDIHDGGLLRKRLEARGEKYFKFLSGPRQVAYRGESLGDAVHWVRITPITVVTPSLIHVLPV